jgi:hypothetical protein
MKRDEQGYPIAECYRAGIHWVIPRCPLCGQRHLHGYADGSVGHLAAHCPPGTPGAERGYVIVPTLGLGPSPSQK